MLEESLIHSFLVLVGGAFFFAFLIYLWIVLGARAEEKEKKKRFEKFMQEYHNRRGNDKMYEFKNHCLKMRVNASYSKHQKHLKSKK